MKVVEIFKSISGEPCHEMQGRVCAFVRFAGCNCNCSYCDTKYANDGSREVREMNPQQIFNEVFKLHVDFCILTGGEPFLQDHKDIKTLVWGLSKNDIAVGIETNGSVPLLLFDEVVQYMIDYKLPGSGMENMMRRENFFKKIPWVPEPIFKFVCSDMKDFFYAKELVKEIRRPHVRPTFVFTGINKDLTKEIIEAVIKGGDDTKGFVVYTQLHKIFNVD